ncbi:MAG: DEAD/DEAH box helicase, partial [Planctomycetota bacterium]|nr:DEAD/DEAH box helicase [Planctomycetota bacterium]
MSTMNPWERAKAAAATEYKPNSPQVALEPFEDAEAANAAGAAATEVADEPMDDEMAARMSAAAEFEPAEAPLAKLPELESSDKAPTSDDAPSAEAPAAPVEEPVNLFAALGLSDNVLAALERVGYETPSPIQTATIPTLLAGKDVLGQAQTGTGKTAAFALPIIDLLTPGPARPHAPQAIVLAPTRELAIQVAEAFQKYASHVPGFHVLPIYGGQAYHHQLRPLERGVHVVVGTPGRVIDHLERGSLKLTDVRQFVLDEADEMLKMGFVEEVDKILARAPDERQIVLFSATMPRQVQTLAETYMREPEVIRLETHTKVADTIRQRYLILRGNLKLDALTRILETETYDAMLIFARTKNDTVELADKLEARGHAVSPLNGDMPQSLREKTVERLKAGKLDIIVATDVAARGLDVERITHVLNYDLPTGVEAYTHRIGRTGRAGRKGEAILFVKPQERRMLNGIERATSAPLEMYKVPSNDEVNASRIERFKERIVETIKSERTDGTKKLFSRIVVEILESVDAEPEDVFAALAEMAQGDQPLLFEGEGRQNGRERSEDERQSFRENGFRPGGNRGDRQQRGGNDRGRFGGNDRGRSNERFGRDDRGRGNDRFSRDDRGRGNAGGFPRDDRGPSRFSGGPAPAPVPTDEAGKVRYRVEVGHEHGLRPGNLVGALANEGGVEGGGIGRIEIYDTFTTVDLPVGMPPEIYQRLQKSRVRGQALRISEVGADPPPSPGRGRDTTPTDPEENPMSTIILCPG